MAPFYCASGRGKKEFHREFTLGKTRTARRLDKERVREYKSVRVRERKGNPEAEANKGLRLGVRRP